LGRFGVSGTRVALTSFDAYFASAIGASARTGVTEDRNLYFVMQTINKRPNALNATHVKSTVSASAIGGSPLHPFDYELLSGASIRNDTLWLSGGEDCWGGPHRHVRIAFVCGDADALIDVRENGKCAYEVVVATPSACCTGPSRSKDLSTDARRKLRFIDGELRRLNVTLT
jgi:hypothetical protein